MEFGLLGPLHVHDGEGLRVLSGARQRVVLAALLLRSDRVVAIDDLVEMLWDENPPSGAVNTARNHVMRLRRALGGVAAKRIITRGAGYLVDLGGAGFDLHRFTLARDLAIAEVKACDWQAAARHLADALAQWRGDALADVASRRLHDEYGPQLAEAHLHVLQLRIQADLRLGKQGLLAGELQRLVAAHPFRESLVALLMQAHYAEGRRAEALDAYRQTYRRLGDDLGIEPGPELQRLHQLILTDDPALAPETRQSAEIAAVAQTASDGSVQPTPNRNLTDEAPADGALDHQHGSAHGELSHQAHEPVDAVPAPPPPLQPDNAAEHSLFHRVWPTGDRIYGPRTVIASGVALTLLINTAVGSVIGHGPAARLGAGPEVRESRPVADDSTVRPALATTIEAYAGPSKCPGNTITVYTRHLHGPRMTGGDWTMVQPPSSTGQPCTATIAYSPVSSAARPDGYNAFEWYFATRRPGITCSVFVYIPNDGLASANGQYHIKDAPPGGKSDLGVVAVDQAIEHGAWVPAGRFTFASGTAEVRLDASTFGHGVAGTVAASTVHLSC